MTHNAAVERNLAPWPAWQRTRGDSENRQKQCNNQRLYVRRNTRLPGDIRTGQATIGGTVVEPTSLLRPKNTIAVLLSYDAFFHTRSGYRSAVRVLPQQHAKNPARGSGRAD